MNMKPTESFSHSGLDIRLEILFAENSKILGRPIFLKTKVGVAQAEEDHPFSPLPYFTDAILGLSAFQLTLNANDYASTSEVEELVSLLWQKLEPMHEVYRRSHQRVSPLLQIKPSLPSKEMEIMLEQSLKDILKQSCTTKGIDLTEVLNLIDSLNYFEAKRSHPLLFDTQLQISESTLRQLHILHSLLYNLRAVIAIFYNSTRKEMLYESLHLDSVKDYFHAPDLLTNETMLYFQFLNLCKKGQIKDQSEALLNKAFKNHLPHSHYLVHSLPGNFFTNQNFELLEQSLYTFQIDWLLGSPAGLLYRIREELMGIKEGYENTFWPELQNEESSEPSRTLQVNCVLDNTHIHQLSEQVA